MSGASAEPTGLGGPEGLEPASSLHPADAIPSAGTFDTSVIEERLREIDPKFLEPLIKKAADNFYCQVLDTVDGYLIENLDHNMSSHIKMLERENQQMRTELWDVDCALGCHSLGHQSRLDGIKQTQREFNKATNECWRLRGVNVEALDPLTQTLDPLVDTVSWTANAVDVLRRAGVRS